MRDTTPHQPTEATRAAVKALVAFGITQPEIAVHLQIGERTLRRHYERELAIGILEANAKVANRLYNAATEWTGKEAVTAMIFWLKTRARWHEVQRHEHTGVTDGPPIKFVITKDEAEA